MLRRGREEPPPANPRPAPRRRSRKRPRRPSVMGTGRGGRAEGLEAERGGSPHTSTQVADFPGCADSGSLGRCGGILEAEGAAAHSMPARPPGPTGPRLLRAVREPESATRRRAARGRGGGGGHTDRARSGLGRAAAPLGRLRRRRPRLRRPTRAPHRLLLASANFRCPAGRALPPLETSERSAGPPRNWAELSKTKHGHCLSVREGDSAGPWGGTGWPRPMLGFESFRKQGLAEPSKLN